MKTKYIKYPFLQIRHSMMSTTYIRTYVVEWPEKQTFAIGTTSFRQKYLTLDTTKHVRCPNLEVCAKVDRVWPSALSLFTTLVELLRFIDHNKHGTTSNSSNALPVNILSKVGILWTTLKSTRMFKIVKYLKSILRYYKGIIFNWYF
jgi:hypothetical protein